MPPVPTRAGKVGQGREGSGHGGRQAGIGREVSLPPYWGMGSKV